MNLETAICGDNVKVLLNLDELKKSDNLKDANIFNILFGFVNEGFKKVTLKKDEDGYITIFKDYHITSHEVLNFLYFVRYGKCKYENNIECMEDGKKKDEYINLFIQTLDEMATKGVLLKLGPFPVFDEYIINMREKIKQINMNKKNKKLNNPMTPEEDKNHLYYWLKSYSTPEPVNIPNHENLIWSVTNTCNNDEDMRLFYRCKIPTPV